MHVRRICCDTLHILLHVCVVWGDTVHIGGAVVQPFVSGALNILQLMLITPLLPSAQSNAARPLWSRARCTCWHQHGMRQWLPILPLLPLAESGKSGL